MIDAIRNELKHSIRGLVKSPVFTLIAVLSLALGIGANTAVFSVVSALVFRPLPYPEANRLVDVYEHHPTEICAGCGVGTSYPAYLDLQQNVRSFQSTAAYRSEPTIIALSGGAERWNGAHVSAALFPILAVQPLHGRVFTESEDVVRGAPVVVIGERLWRARFDAEPNVVGQTIRVGGQQRTVIGIMPDDLAFPSFAELWLPIAPVASRETRADRNIGVIARLADGVLLETAQTEMAGLGAQAAQAYPETNAGWTAHVSPLRAELIADYLPSFYLMLGMVAFVLLVACANLANLLIARASGRRQELAVRVALGASRLALSRHVLAESLLLSVVAAALGLLVASWALDAFTAVTDGALPAWVRYTIDERVVLFALLLALGTGALFGLLPALQVARTDVNFALTEGNRSSTAGRSRTRVRNALVAVQVAAALVLVFGAAFMTREFLRINDFDPGYRIEGLYGGQISLPAGRYDQPRALAAQADVLAERIRAATASNDVALSNFFVPNWPGTPQVEMRVQGRESAEVAASIHRVINITPAYFRTHGITLSAGRDFGVSDGAGAPRVGIVGSALAAKLWPGESPIGRQLHLGRADDDWITIVGVVPSARTSPFARDQAQLLYLPMAQRALAQPWSTQLAMHVRLARADAGLARRLRAAGAAIDPDIVVENVMSARQSNAEWMAPVRMTMLAVSGLGLFAVLLAAMGIYGLIAYTVTQRTPEIGLRIALGATRNGILQLVVRQAMLLAAVGVVLGALGAIGLERALRSQFFAAPSSLFILLLLVPCFLAVAALASWLPARRAAHTDPMTTLRAD